MNTIYTKNRDGFVFDEATQTLVPYEFKSAIVNFSSGIVIHKCLVDGLESEYSGEFNVYLNEDYFKRSEAHKGSIWTFEEVVERVYGCFPHNEVELYGFVNGEAKLVDVSVFRYILDNGQDWKSADGKQFYPSASRVYDFHDYKVKDENGDVRVVKSAYSRLSLTDEQMAVALDFERAFKKLRELNVQMYYDMEGESMEFVNNEHIERTLWGEPVNDMIDLRGMGYDISFYPISYNSCDYDLSVKMK